MGDVIWTVGVGEHVYGLADGYKEKLPSGFYKLSHLPTFGYVLEPDHSQSQFEYVASAYVIAPGDFIEWLDESIIPDPKGPPLRIRIDIDAAA